MASTLRHRAPYWTPQKQPYQQSGPSLDLGLGPRRHRPSATGSNNNYSVGLILLLAVLPWLYQYNLQQQVTLMQERVSDRILQYQKLMRSVRWAKANLQGAERHAIALEESNDDLMLKLLFQGDNIDRSTAQYEQAKAVEEAHLARLDAIRTTIARLGVEYMQQHQSSSSSQPLEVQVTLNKPVGGDAGAEKPYFVIRMAPNNVAPHASSHFIQMVQAKLFDGLSLMHSSHGSLIIHSAAMDPKSGALQEERFEKAQLSTLAYSERSAIFPNEKYTVAFSSQGPHFYINMGAELGGSDEIDEHESCFGKVVKGQEVLDQVMSNGSKSLTVLGIESIRLL